MRGEFSTDKLDAVAILTENGIPINKAIETVGYKSTSMPSVKTAIKKHTLTQPHLLKKGVRVAEKILNDFIEEKEGARASDALKVVEMQQARHDPPKQQLEVNSSNTNISITYEAKVKIIEALSRQGLIPPQLSDNQQTKAIEGEIIHNPVSNSDKTE